MQQKETKRVVKLQPRITRSVQILTRSAFNLPNRICNHILGKEHKIHHRITAGTIIMIVGVIISKSGGGVSLVAVHYILDTVGYLLHGIGTIPWIEYLTENMQKKQSSSIRNLLGLETLDEKLEEEQKKEINFK